MGAYLILATESTKLYLQGREKNIPNVYNQSKKIKQYKIKIFIKLILKKSFSIPTKTVFSKKHFNYTFTIIINSQLES